jgi:xanthine dehydrogenase YagS FAD-binding subunit
MKPFRLLRVATLVEAGTRVAQDPGARVLRAGGIDLLDLMKEGITTPTELVELRSVGDEHGRRLRGVEVEEDGGWRVGALVTLAQLEAFEDLPVGHAALRQAASSAATPAIRNAATVGGNLLQRPRCWYLRHKDLECLRKGGAECLARSGRNGPHAILGGGPCYIVHPSTLAVALLALDAGITAIDRDGKLRTIALSDLYVLPKVDPRRAHSLAPGEVLVAVDLGPAARDQRSVYLAAKHKKSHDWPLAEAAVRATLARGTLADVRVALGHVAPVPWRAEAAERALEGQAPSADLFARAAALALEGARPIGDNAYKIRVAEGLVRAALHHVADVPLPA